jgi:glycerol-3-phosphate acyltransferase
VVAELEGALLRGTDTFPYFMLVAFEASGLPRFAALLALWPLLRLLEQLFGRGDLSLRLAAFVATAGVPRAEVEAVSRAVLPKFMADDVDAAAWAAFGACEGRRVVVTRLPRVMAEWFAREHLGAHEVVGCDLEYSRLKRSTGVVRGGSWRAVADRVRELFADGDRPDLGIGRSEMARAFLPFCRVRIPPALLALYRVLHLHLVY